MKRIIRLACLAVTATILCPPTPVAAQRPFDEIIVFGHSGSDTGNDFLLSGEVVAAPPYFGGRFSNGPLWIEWLANRLGFQHPTKKNFYPGPSLAGGTCYAYGGAETGSGFSDSCLGVGPNKVCAPNVGLQIEMFFADGRTLDGDELIVVRAGGNDASPVIAARNMGDHIATLAAAGGKVFLVPGERRISQDPGRIEADPSMDTFVASFNAALGGAKARRSSSKTNCRMATGDALRFASRSFTRIASPISYTCRSSVTSTSTGDSSSRI